MTLSVGDGFKFGCGLILSLVAFYFVLVIFLTGFLLTAMLLNLPVPQVLAQTFSFLQPN
ncbi:MAG: hypothetical protein HYY30_07310 [Chloroflexi bacterium]|nr:hypothetical protein [Chloroflexota bacterium]